MPLLRITGQRFHRKPPEERREKILRYPAFEVVPTTPPIMKPSPMPPPKFRVPWLAGRGKAQDLLRETGILRRCEPVENPPSSQRPPWRRFGFEPFHSSHALSPLADQPSRRLRMPTPQGVDQPLDGAVTDVEEKVELLGKRQIPSSVGRSKLVPSRSPGVELTFKVAVLISGKKDQAADLGSFTPELHRFFL